MKLFLFYCILDCVLGLTLVERNELSRKFKYYFSSVRPTAPENYVSGPNGTFFNVATEVHLLLTSIRPPNVFVDLVVAFTWTDDRLTLRELSERFEVPDEFPPWMPRARTSPSPHSQSIFLAPQTGKVTWYHRVKDIVACTTETWKHPFAAYTCEFLIENIGDELLTVSSLKDLRQDRTFNEVNAHIAPFPSANLVLSFPSIWQSSILNVFLPSILVVSLVFFAQWKRRKVQVLVSTAALVCILVMLTSSRTTSGASLLDLWLSGCFLHVAFLLAVDLVLPARRVRYTLMVPVEERSPSPVHIITKSEVPTNRFMTVLERVALLLGRSKIRRQPKVSTQIVNAQPGETPVQRNVTKATLGERKRLALLTIAASYIAFTVIYFMLALSCTPD